MIVFNDFFHIFLNKGGRLVGQEHLADGSAVEIHLIAKFLHHLYVVGTVHLFDHKTLVAYGDHQIRILLGPGRKSGQERMGGIL